MDIDIETHPWPPYIPDGAKIIIMGTFPPQQHRWSIDFYYPNRTNDFWYMMGLIFYNDKYALCKPLSNDFDIDKIKTLLDEKHIALNDTGRKIRRLKGNASDKYLKILEPVSLASLLAHMPDCKNIITTGEKAAGVIAELTQTAIPKMGEKTDTDDGLHIWRMPSTSRAYPLALSKKADYYRKAFESAQIL